MSFTKELKNLRNAEKRVATARKRVARKFEKEVKKTFKKFKEDTWQFKCGMGTFLFSKNNDIIHEKVDLPKELKKLYTFLDEREYLQAYLGDIN